MIELGLEASQADRFHFFNSFFYKKLSEKSGEEFMHAGLTKEQRKQREAQANHARVKKWTKVRCVAGCWWCCWVVVCGLGCWLWLPVLCVGNASPCITPPAW